MASSSARISVVEHLQKEGYALNASQMAIFGEINRKLPDELKYFLTRRDGVAVICESSSQAIVPGEMGDDAVQHAWHLCGLFYFNLGRFHEALAVFNRFYDHMLQYQEQFGKRLHKGTPLVRISECHEQLAHPVLSKRYLMLTACEDAISNKGKIDAETTGLYFRMIWGRGMTHGALLGYAARCYEISEKHPSESFYPEWILQELDDQWMAEYPSVQEAGIYAIARPYVRHLLGGLGSSAGKSLERLAHYLLTSMPGCRSRRRTPTKSTDYDVVCTVEGTGLDFRSELGRYFICECKDWEAKADFTTMAKFCRVLDSAKCSFGILFSKNGISGEGAATNAEREQIKVFQQRGMVVVVISEADLREVADGANFLTMLRTKYEQVRLDLRA